MAPKMINLKALKTEMKPAGPRGTGQTFAEKDNDLLNIRKDIQH